jgi:hypothetical protein
MARAAILTGVLLAGAIQSGCNVVGAMADTYERSATHTVKAQYTGLGGKSFAVLVAADRNIQSQVPMLVEEFTRRMTERLSAPGNVPLPSGFVPATDALAFTYRNPTWHLRTPAKLAADLGGVDQVVMVEITEFRLHEPGNRYVWNGRASARISVADATADEFTFDRVVDVKYPDTDGLGQEQLQESQVLSALLVRLLDRSSWLFYDHEEKVRPDY